MPGTSQQGRETRGREGSWPGGKCWMDFGGCLSNPRTLSVKHAQADTFILCEPQTQVLDLTQEDRIRSSLNISHSILPFEVQANVSGLISLLTHCIFLPPFTIILLMHCFWEDSPQTSPRRSCMQVTYFFLQFLHNVLHCVNIHHTHLPMGWMTSYLLYRKSLEPWSSKSGNVTKSRYSHSRGKVSEFNKLWKSGE